MQVLKNIMMQGILKMRMISQDCFVLPIWPSYSSTNTPDLNSDEKRDGPREEEQLKLAVLLVNTVSTPFSTASPHEGLTLSDPTNPEQDDSEIPPFEDIYQHSSDGIFTTSSYDDEGAVADFTNLEIVVNVLVDLPYGKKAIGTKWVYRNKKDERGVVCKKQCKVSCSGHRQEGRYDYDEVFAPVARIEAIRIFLAFASYMGFIVYQMDVKSAFLYGKIDEEFDCAYVEMLYSYWTQKPLVMDERRMMLDGSSL
ncbi:putative ribonuclease H-like domain-containing protein [Tanacetum coccineum]